MHFFDTAEGRGVLRLLPFRFLILDNFDKNPSKPKLSFSIKYRTPTEFEEEKKPEKES
jgi:hypothetical protein